MRLLAFVVSLWLATSPLQGKIVFYSKRDGNSEIYTMESDGRNQVRLTHSPTVDFFPAWSPNGRQILFTSDRDGNPEVYVMDADGGNQRNLSRHPGSDVAGNWSPDGKRIVFKSSRAGANAPGRVNGIYIMDNQGQNIQLVIKMEFIAELKWSPDGKRIAFEGSMENGAREIYVVDADGTDLWQASQSVAGGIMFIGGWSPDSKQIIYTGLTREGEKEVATIVIVTLDEKGHEAIEHERVKLPHNPWLSVSGEAWGSDGKSILIAGRIGIWNIYRFRFADRKLIQLTDSPATDFAPDEWNPLLPVLPQGLLPTRWGEIKSHSHHYRGIGRGSRVPVP